MQGSCRRLASAMTLEEACFENLQKKGNEDCDPGIQHLQPVWFHIKTFV